MGRKRVINPFLIRLHCVPRSGMIIPYRLILHVVLVFSATYSCVVFNSIHGIDSRAVGANFERSFFPQDWREFAGE